MATRVLTPSTWQLARLSSAEQISAVQHWIPATVPGAVQLDWAQAEGFPDLYYGDNVHAYDGLEDSFWLYRTTIPAAQLAAGERLVMSSAGLDYHAEFWLDGQYITSHTGVCTPFELDLTHATVGARLEILFHPAPKKEGAPVGRSQAAHVTKPAVSYGWDWHPYLVPLGLCDEVKFEVRPAAYIHHVDFRYTLEEDFSAAQIVVSVESTSSATYRWELRDPDGHLVLSGSQPEATLRAPRLWWTHDHGKPELYTLDVVLDAPGKDRLKRCVGFRRVRLVMHEGAWNHPVGFPKSRSLPPITLELNGRRIFARGSSWVNPDIFPGRVTEDTYRPLLEMARDAHFNLLRCWGGTSTAKESFFEQCDALGLLAWQEFPLSCNAYPDAPAYLADLDRESRAIIRRVRQHPCLALWCGGNELFNSWSGMDDQSHALRLLNRNCFELDPQTPFLPTAPVEGMGHGDYRFRDTNGVEIFQIFQQSTNTAYTEFGCPGLSPVPYLHGIIPKMELWPPKAGTSWETHHAFKAWSPDPGYWINASALEHYFGESTCIEQMVRRGEWLQCEGYKGAFEEARRQLPRCSMALNWCYNEAWPTAANNSLINFPAIPKPAYFAAQAACRPVLASARIPKFQWVPGDLFSAELWILSDHPEEQEAGELTAYFICGSTTIELLRWSFPGLQPQQNLAGPAVRLKLPPTLEHAFTINVQVSGHLGWDSSYSLSLKQETMEPIHETPLLNM